MLQNNNTLECVCLRLMAVNTWFLHLSSETLHFKNPKEPRSLHIICKHTNILTLEPLAILIVVMTEK